MWPLDILPQVWRPWHVAYYERQYVSPTANCIRHHRYMQSCRAWSPSLFDRDALLSLIPQASTQAAIPVLLRKTQELHLTSSGGRDSCEQVVQQDARRDGHVQAVHAERRLALAALGRRRNAEDVLRGHAGSIMYPYLCHHMPERPALRETLASRGAGRHVALKQRAVQAPGTSTRPEQFLLLAALEVTSIHGIKDADSSELAMHAFATAQKQRKNKSCP